MSQRWDYQADLAPGMTHSLQVQTDSASADFNVRVLDASGAVIAEDTGPDAGAECSFHSATGGPHTIQIELVEGSGGFSLNVASGSERQRPARQAQPAPRKAPRKPVRDTSTPSGLGDRTADGIADEANAIVARHNQWRSRFGTAPLQWSEELASHAQLWADHLAETGMQMRHRSPNEFGENLFWASGKRSTPKEVVDAWGNEVELYDYDENNWWPAAGHFSQVVWHNTTHVGLGIARRDGQEIWVCNYSPRGNWTGQRPFTR